MSHGGIISQRQCCHNITMKILTSLITAIVTIFHPAGVDLNTLSAAYRSSQYCLSDYRAQHRIDQLLPEYSRECDANPVPGQHRRSRALYSCRRALPWRARVPPRSTGSPSHLPSIYLASPPLSLALPCPSSSS